MTPPQHDLLQPDRDAAAAAWAARVRAEHSQVERLREVEDPADFYAPMARRFGQDPRRQGEPALEVLRSLARPDEVWLDIGAGGGRYSLPLALVVRRVMAIDPSPAMLEVLRDGMAEYAIDNIDVRLAQWPLEGPGESADVALMAHVGYDIEGFGVFLDAAEASARRCVVIMRANDGGRQGIDLWREIYGEPREPYPMLAELLVLLVARGVCPEVRLVDREPWGHDSLDELLESTRRQLWLRPGSARDLRLTGALRERASERDGSWAIEWGPLRDGIVSWEPRDKG